LDFGCNYKEDGVEIYGSKGKIEFSIFKEAELILKTNNNKEKLFVENPKNVQLFYVENMKKQLFNKNYEHPSNRKSATHVSWVMDKILGKK